MPFFATFEQLGGKSVSIQEYINEIKTLPLDGVLGILGAISIELVQAGSDFIDPRKIQGYYLNYAIVDDFPFVLPKVHEMYIPGHVPQTGGKHIFLHEQNIAWLSHLTLLYSNQKTITPKLNYDLVRRVCRLLLIANDFLDTKCNNNIVNLVDRRHFFINWLRLWQFNQYFENIYSTMTKLSRQWILFNEFLPKHFNIIHSAFVEATNGISLKRFFEILAILITHYYTGMKPGVHWLSKDNMCSTIKINKEEIEIITKRWSISADKYADVYNNWEKSRPAKDEYIPFIDFVSLKNTPFVEARTGDLVCPVLPFLLAKIIDGAFFILTDYFNVNNGQVREQFQTALGYAYQDYAHDLLKTIGMCDKKGKWEIEANPKSKNGSELSDSYLQRGDFAISFEHKSLRPDTEFLRGGPGDRILGPNDKVLSKLDNDVSVTIQEGLDSDEGLITRGIWQQSNAGKSLCLWAEGKFKKRPKKILPVITNLAHIRIDDIVQKGYLNPLIKKAKIYSDGFWLKPQWLNISDLEKLAALAEEGVLDIEKLLTEKNSKYFEIQFDVYLYQEYKSKFILKKLFNTATDLLNNAKVAYWP